MINEQSAKRSALKGRMFKIQIKSSLAAAPLQRRFAAGPHNRLLRCQYCSSLCSQSEGHEHVANMANASGHDFVGFSAHAWPPQYSSPSLCEQSELQCFASELRCMFAQRRPLKGRVFKIQIKLKFSGSALAAENCAGLHNRLLRRQHCSSLCSQSEGHEHVANMGNASGHNFVGFLARARPPQYSSPSLCKQSELQCFASGLRCMFAQRVFLSRSSLGWLGGGVWLLRQR